MLVMSGVTHGAVPGSLPFVIHVNDLNVDVGVRMQMTRILLKLLMV